MLRSNIFQIGFLVLIVTLIAQGQSPETESLSSQYVTKNELEEAARKITVTVEVEEDEIEELQNRTSKLEALFGDTKTAVSNLIRGQERLFEVAKNISVGVENVSDIVSDISSKMAVRAMLIPTKYDDKHDCEQGCDKIRGIPNNCAEAMKENDNKNGVYLQKIEGSALQPFGAYCTNFLNNAWTIIQRRHDGSVSFHRNWTDYKNGFGNLNGEYWLGLDRIHALTTKRKHELWIQLTAYSGETRFALYPLFSVAGENEYYKLKLGGISGNLEDSMGINNGMKFSTFDKDNDLNKSGAESNGGWWCRSCTFSNLNGDYFKGNEPPKGALMAIRPVTS